MKNLQEIKEIVIEIKLYSVYLFEAMASAEAPFQAILVEHFPASEPSVQLLPIKIPARATKMEKSKMMMDSLNAHFTQTD